MVERKKEDQNVEGIVLSLLAEERKDSIQERKELQRAFLKAIDKQTEKQTEALKELGDRLESSVSEMRSDIRSNTNRITGIIVLALLIVASLGGLSIRYVKGGTQLDMSPSIIKENSNK
tara:strand:+ start:1989 stop:2345 length:357 start_codon:yes stop_codon:yes gene_type:complete